MVNQFLLLKSARKLEGYLTRESDNLEKMKKNNNVSTGFLESKVAHYNGLVETLNTLFSGLSGDTDPLFDRYVLYEGEDLPFAVTLPAYDASDEMDEHTHTQQTTPELAYLNPSPQAQGSNADTETEQEDIEIKFVPEDSAEKAGSATDETVSETAEAGQQRAAEILDEYARTSDHDIAKHDPDADEPVAVFHRVDVNKDGSVEPKEDAESLHTDAFVDESAVEVELTDDENVEDLQESSGEMDLSYFHSTADGTRVDANPIQIADVETAVERAGESGSAGTVIDLNNYRYKEDGEVSHFDSFMEKELGQFRNASSAIEDENESLNEMSDDPALSHVDSEAIDEEDMQDADDSHYSE